MERMDLNWLQIELEGDFSSNKTNDPVKALREIRQQWLLFFFWKKYCSEIPSESISHQLDRLLVEIDKEKPGIQTLFMLDEFKLDYGAAGFSKNKGIPLCWKPETSKNTQLFVALEPNSWQNFELPNEEQQPQRK